MSKKTYFQKVKLLIFFLCPVSRNLYYHLTDSLSFHIFSQANYFKKKNKKESIKTSSNISNIIETNLSFRLAPSSPWSQQCRLGFSGRRWRTDHSDQSPWLRCCCPSCNRWLTAPHRAAGRLYWSVSCPCPPPPSHCPSPPRPQSSDPALPSRWTSCRRRPSLSCSSQSSAFSPLSTAPSRYRRDDNRLTKGQTEIIQKAKRKNFDCKTIWFGWFYLQIENKCDPKFKWGQKRACFHLLTTLYKVSSLYKILVV